MSIDSLFQPFTVRGLTLDNRWVMSAMSHYKSPDGVPGQEMVDYHRERAGEVGLALVGATGIPRPASNNHPNLGNINDSTADAWRAVVEAVHAKGTPFGIQIWHAGCLFNAHEWRPAPLESPSGIDHNGETIGTPMTDADIEDTIAAYAKAASIAAEVGFDTVEIHGAHGFLIDQFFWDVTNRRTDKWGGDSIAERSQFCLEVVKAVRAAIGEDRPLLLKISQWKEQSYTTKLAHSPAELVDWLGPLSDAGVDVFDCSQRRFWVPEFEGSDLNLAGWVKREIGKPTITIGSVGLSNDVMQFFDGDVSERRPLDELIRRFEAGEFDLVAVGRTLLAEPGWVGQARSGAHTSLGSVGLTDVSFGW